MTTIQIILVAISVMYLFTRIRGFVRREKNQTLFKLVTTILVWGGILYTSLFPKKVHEMSTRLGFGENLNTLIFFGFVIVFVILFKLLASVENLERILTDIVRKDALKDIKSKKD